MPEKEPWLTAFGATVAISALFTIGFVAGSSWGAFREFMAGPAASWVGGLGSAGAVVGAVWAVNRQIRHQRESEDLSERLKMRGQLRSLLGMLQYAQAEVLKVEYRTSAEQPVTPAEAIIMSIECRRAHAQLQQLSPLVFIESPPLVIALGTASSAIEVLIAELGGYVQGTNFGYHNADSLRMMASRMAVHINNSVTNAQYVILHWEQTFSLPQRLAPAQEISNQVV